MSLFFITEHGGIVIGYGLSYFLELNWPMGFVFQAAMMAVTGILFLTVPKAYFDESANKDQAFLPIAGSNSLLREDKVLHSQNLNQLKSSVLANDHIKQSIIKSTFNKNKPAPATGEPEVPMGTIIKSVLGNIPYNGVSLALTNVMFLLMGFELWGPPYLR